MHFARFASAAFLLTTLSTSAAAQDGASVVAAASKAMAADTLTSITYSGTARNGALGQSKDIGEPTTKTGENPANPQPTGTPGAK